MDVIGRLNLAVGATPRRPNIALDNIAGKITFPGKLNHCCSTCNISKKIRKQ